MSFIVNPSTIDIEGMDDRKEEIRDFLRYYDKSMDFQIAKFKRARWFKEKYGEEEFKERLEQLKAEREKSLLLEGRDEELSTYSGVLRMLTQRFPDQTVVQNFTRPQPQGVPWLQVPPPLRVYQNTAAEKLLHHGHAAVEMGTGVGKSFIIQYLLRQLGLKAVVMAPSLNIAGQLYKDFSKYIGARYVGRYYDGKKESKKLITVGIHASLAKVQAGSEAFNELSQAQVFIADESHMTPAETLKAVCMGLCRNAPWRFFFSGTQTRTDGAELLLKGIIGEIVFRYTVKQGVDEGFLARPKFHMLEIPSMSSFASDDPNDMTRRHLLYNPAVNEHAAKLANAMVRALKHQVLILVDEIEQFSYLLPHLRYKVGFAHGPLTKENKGTVPEAYQRSEADALVEQFNAGELPILVGTSCIATGTDIRPVKSMIYLMGGKSEIQVSQAVGRTTRKPEGKEWCNIFDYDVINVPVVHRHAEAREEIYESIYGPVNRMSAFNLAG